MLRREAWLATVIECFRPVPDEPVALEIAATQQRTQSNTSWKKALRFVSQVMILLSSAFCQGRNAVISRKFTPGSIRSNSPLKLVSIALRDSPPDG